MKRLLFLLSFLFLMVAESFGDYISIDDISEKVRWSDLVQAKQKAFDSALAKGFNELIAERYPEALSLQNKVELKQIHDCVFDYSISNEKAAGNSYSASFSFRFDSQKVNQLFAQHGIKTKIEFEQKKDFVVAIYRSDYPKCYNLFNSHSNKVDITVVRFSGKVVILKSSEDIRQILRENNIRFATVDA